MRKHSASLVRLSNRYVIQCKKLKMVKIVIFKVEAALLVSQELIRVAIPWQEAWHSDLEEAWRLFHVDKNVGGMLYILNSLHQAISQVSIF